jgi:peptidoglycan DL-endopeptidase CwlO
VQALEQKVSHAAKQVAAAHASADRARTALEADAINAYVHGGSNPLTAGGTAMGDATNGLLRAEYVNSLATDQSDAIDSFRTAAVVEQSAKANLQQQTKAAQAAVTQVAQDRQAAMRVQGQLQANLNQDTGRIAVLVAQQQAAAAAAAAAAERARIAAQQRAQAAAAAAAQAAAQQASQRAAAAAAASASPPTQVVQAAPVVQAAAVAAPSTAAPASAAAPESAPAPAPVSAPPVGQGAAGAVAAAESRVGDTYSFGAAGPTSFDCSGLVMWAYAQVGISLPHFSGAQYADTTHIPMSALEPGDLVFPADPGQHVAMYVGGGMIAEAADYGIPVHVVAMGSWFVLASRVV